MAQESKSVKEEMKEKDSYDNVGRKSKGIFMIFSCFLFLVLFFIHYEYFPLIRIFPTHFVFSSVIH